MRFYLLLFQNLTTLRFLMDGEQHIFLAYLFCLIMESQERFITETGTETVYLNNNDFFCFGKMATLYCFVPIFRFKNEE